MDSYLGAAESRARVMSDLRAWTTSEAIRQATRTQRKHGIRRRFIIAIVALVALVLVSQAAFLSYFGHLHLRDHVGDEARAFSKLAAAPISEAYWLYHDSGRMKFHGVVEETADLIDDLQGLTIYDAAGRSLFSWHRQPDDGNRPNALPAPPEDDRLLTAIDSLEQRSWLAPTANDTSRLIVVQPYVEDWGRHRLSVVFWFGFKSADSAFAHFRRGLALLAFGGLVLGACCAYVLGGQSLGPVEQLTAGARELAKGQLDHRIRLRSGDEFEVLGATLDHMAELLSETVADLETSNRHLGSANEELRQLDKVKSDLLANVSHELRTPLTAISGFVEAMEAGLLGDVNTVQKDSLGVVARNISRLRSMIEQLLSYSRMDSGLMKVNLQPFDLEAVARQVVEAVSAARGGKVAIEIRILTELSEAYGDSTRIAQVLENLLTNAVKFSPPDAQVELVIDRPAEGLEMQVIDHGIGIAPKHRELIFDRFFQVDASSRRQYGGMGLGLAIVKEILDLHHATIQVHDTEGGGTTFRCVLPAAEDRTGLIAVGAGQRRLLIIDDDISFVQKMSTFLSQRGWQVQTAATGEQGSIIARRGQPEAILLDRLLPDQDGFDLVTRLQTDEQTRFIPVILCTERTEKALGLRLGAADYWIKPIEPEDALRRLETVIEKRTKAQRPGEKISSTTSPPTMRAPTARPFE